MAVDYKKLHYPLDLFTNDPLTDNERPYIILFAYEIKFDTKNFKSWKETLKTVTQGPPGELKGSIALPMPNSGLLDSVSHDFGPSESPLANMLGNNKLTGENFDLLQQQTGIVRDPFMTNIYKGTTPRTWNAEWDFIPQSKEEAEVIKEILLTIKKWSSPDKTGVVAMKSPMIWKIKFSNERINKMMNFNKMALSNCSINYFADGYAATYYDGNPKHISLSMSFNEFGLKYQDEWDEKGE